MLLTRLVNPAVSFPFPKDADFDVRVCLSPKASGSAGERDTLDSHSRNDTASAKLPPSPFFLPFLHTTILNSLSRFSVSSAD